MAFPITLELGVNNFKTGMQYSLTKEIKRVLKYVNDPSITEQLNVKISEYKEIFLKEIQSSSTSSEGNDCN